MPLIIDIKVVPLSGKNGCIIDKAGKIKIFLKNPAQDGKANTELIKTIAKALSCTQRDITILKGLTDPRKRILIDKELSLEDFLRAMGVHEQQAKLFE